MKDNGPIESGIWFRRFANVKVVRALALLLQQFESNTDEVNHYVTKMLHRIAWTCKMPAMIFQASIFRVFQRILESKEPAHKVTRRTERAALMKEPHVIFSVRFAKSLTWLRTFRTKAFDITSTDGCLSGRFPSLLIVTERHRRSPRVIRIPWITLCCFSHSDKIHSPFLMLAR